MLSKKQNTLYFSVWGKAKKARAGLDRHALHAEPCEQFPDGLPASHLDWSSKHLDEWMSRCKAIADGGDYTGQIRQIRQPQERWLRSIKNLRWALGYPVEYADGILDQMNLRGAMGGNMATLQTLPAAKLEKVFIALKIECRRTWPKKIDLLRAIWAEVPKLTPKVAQTACLEALGWDRLPFFDKMVYENLLIVLGALRQAAPAPVEDTAVAPF